MLFALSLLLAVTVGCGRGSTEADVAPEQATYQDMTAEQFLQSVFARYRNAESYRDSGRVRLSYQANGQSLSEVAPLSTWFDRNSLYVDAYDAHLRHTPSGFTAWITDPTTDNFDSQVVRTASQPGRPTIDALLSDTVLRERITAGLAGPPPQLEWLFAAEPMKLLFDGPFQIGYGKPTKVEQRDCITIIVQAEDDAYRFAIDQRSGVIRQVELPTILAPMRFQTSNADNQQATGPGQSIRLTLELAGATFESPREQVSLSELPRLPRYVSHFIPLPPDPPSPALDTRLSPIRVRDQGGRITLTHRGLECDFTVLLVASDHPSDLASAANLIQWATVMPNDMRGRIAVGLVVSEAAFRRLPRDCPVPLFLDVDNVIQKVMGVSTGELTVVDRDARIVWIQDGLPLDSVTQLGRIVGDLIDGVDVPTRLRQQWQDDKTTYRAVLNAEIARQPQR
ncbi:MAG: hypothetical protein WBD20_25595 [Pirellulaceae bacterium]